MKITKSILVVLFALSFAQMASAYYCPSTGRWLSRDPVGEPGFQAITQPGISASSAPGRWIQRDTIGERGGLNLYGFVGNKPTSKYDFLGLCCGVKSFSLTDGGWTLTGGALHYNFDIRAVFLDDKTHNPADCAYRQYVQAKKFIMNGQPVSNANGGGPLDGNLNLDSNPWVSNTDPNPQGFIYQNQDTSPRFHSSDTPGFQSGIANGDTFDVEMVFVGRIVDVADKNKIVVQKAFTIKYSGTYPNIKTSP
jgi:hypothetical protein